MVLCLDVEKVLSRPAPDGAGQLGDTHATPIGFPSDVGGGWFRLVHGDLQSRSLPRFTSGIAPADFPISQMGPDARKEQPQLTGILIPEAPFFVLRDPCAVAISRNLSISTGSSQTEGRFVSAGSLFAEFGAVYGRPRTLDTACQPLSLRSGMRTDKLTSSRIGM
jgi:hypothetical protein